MIFVDANYFLRYVGQPATAQDRVMSQAAAALFRLVRAGRETFTTTDAVIAEVVFILSSKRHYNNVPRADVAALLRPILQLRGCKLPRKRLCLAALDLWASSPRLSFVDALGAVHAQRRTLPLASFDADLARVPGVVLWQPPAGTGPT